MILVEGVWRRLSRPNRKDSTRFIRPIGFDLPNAADEKIHQNERRYPADKVRGSAKKYTQY